MSLFAVVRVRGGINVRKDIKDTLSMLKLNKVNHCVLVPDKPEYIGMIKKIKDYVTWGEINKEILKQLIIKRGRIVGNKKISDATINSWNYENIDTLVENIINQEIIYNKLEIVKPIFRLSPPKKGYRHTKRPFKLGGALGYREKKINELLEQMF